MKQLISFISMAFFLVITSAQVQAPKVKKPTSLVVMMEPQDWQAVLSVIDKSAASHTLVVEVQTALLKQLNDTTFQKEHNR